MKFWTSAELNNGMGGRSKRVSATLLCARIIDEAGDLNATQKRKKNSTWRKIGSGGYSASQPLR
jgi:hypothetical protein